MVIYELKQKNQYIGKYKQIFRQMLCEDRPCVFPFLEKIKNLSFSTDNQKKILNFKRYRVTAFLKFKIEFSQKGLALLNCN